MDNNEAKEKFLKIAYKKALIDKDMTLIKIYRQKYITFGKEDLYYYNMLIGYNYWASLTDQEAERVLDNFLYQVECMGVKRPL
jgi:hypothetical protein